MIFLINNAVVKNLERVLEYIEKGKDLTEEDKEKITQETVEYTRDNLNPGWLDYRKSVSDDYTIVEWSDGGEFFYDLDGNSYVDFLGGYGIFTPGHRNPEILDVVLSQIDRQPMNSQELLEPLRGYLAKIMSEITPGDLDHCFFTSGGAEAVEMALKLARIASGKKWFISAVNAFHGKSYGALSVTGKNIYRKPYLPLLQSVQHVEYGVSDDIRKAIRNLQAVGEGVAAVILEPIQGEAGVIVPPKGYLKEVRDICDEYGVFLIIDEIQTGLGRTGTMWRCDAEGIVPDIMTFGKSFGGGLVPATGIIARPKLWIDELVKDPNLLGSPTFGGNPLSSAAALATIRYIIKEDIPGMCSKKGEKIMSILEKLKLRYPGLLIDIRGAGLLIAMEFPKTEIGYFIAKNLFDRHFLTAGTLNNSKVIRIEPPAIVSEGSIDKLGKTLDEVFKMAVGEFNLN
ncbi:aminotransferase class III-fold pyridoxal phosphate-dependent enzyme [Clostridium sp. LBM24168]